MGNDVGSNVLSRTERAVMNASYTASVDATETLEEILGEALPATVRLVIVNNTSSTPLYYNVGATTSANAQITGQSLSFWGSKALLDTFEFFTGTATDISFTVYTIESGT
jgi:hypothetical protein